MRTAPPPVLPIFRSRSQARLLSETFLHPDDEYSIADLVRKSGIPTATVHREVSQLLAAGILSEHRVGNVRRIAANNDSPYFEPLRQLVERAFGAESHLRDGLRPLPQVRGAWLFGSYARRLSGQPGLAPNDVDVAVVVDGDADPVYEVCARIGAQLGLEVNATVFSPAEWDDRNDVFIRQIRDSMLVPLIDKPAQDRGKGKP